MTRKQTAAVVLLALALALGTVSHGAGGLTDYFWVSVLALAPMFLQWVTSPEDKNPETTALMAALETEREHSHMLSSLVADHALMVERLRGEIEAVTQGCPVQPPLPFDSEGGHCD